MDISIRQDDGRSAGVGALVATHLQDGASHSPPESMHALGVAALRAPEITFWTAWNGSQLLGCGALKQLSERHGEIKSMHTAQPFRGQGVGTRVLTHIMEEARCRGYARLSLETGSMSAFDAARALYARFGFQFCGPFAAYREDPFSVFMTLELSRD